ncbi:MAG: hypothetical protein ACPLKS_07420 [Caldisericum exile]|uniref:hypothetical protein n=1 Tax=Caldisericum exile TaxID=693075 RepID=UPI003C71886D
MYNNLETVIAQIEKIKNYYVVTIEFDCKYDKKFKTLKEAEVYLKSEGIDFYRYYNEIGDYLGVRRVRG